MWARTAEVALARDGGEDAAFYAAKLATARFWFERVLPESGGLLAMIMAGADGIMSFDDEAFERSA